MTHCLVISALVHMCNICENKVGGGVLCPKGGLMNIVACSFLSDLLVNICI